MIARLFPGQGSQYVGMSRGLAEPGSVGAMMFAKAGEILGYDLYDLCSSGPAESLSATLYSQPAIYVISCVINAGLPVSDDLVIAGHSLGEYAALHAAGAFEFEIGLEIVRKRAELMSEAATRNPGAMFAILGIASHETEKAVFELSARGDTFIANENTPEQTVISTVITDESTVEQVFKDYGAKKIVKLPVSGAFHSPLMSEAAAILRDFLDKQMIKVPAVEVLSNYDARPMASSADIKDKLAKQLTSRVRWTAIMKEMSAMGVEEFIEVGPGKVLQGLVKKNLPDAVILGSDMAMGATC